ncbi:MAG: PilZ domain-containing protein [Gammaproteobacteria bacterium]|nr:PilZ domain-containing protein [Gammaproteobacteria bacterium]
MINNITAALIEDDRRDMKRRHLIYNLAVLKVETDEEIGRLADISTEGLMIASPAKQPLHERMTLTFALPESCQRFENVVFEAEARWHKDDANPEYELTGYQIIDPGADYKMLCKLLVRQIGFKE